MIAAFSFASLACALATATPAPPPTAITGVRVVDGSTDAVVNVIIVGDRIAAVGAGVAAPAGAVVVDGRGKVLTPGFFATLSQLGLVEVGLESASDDEHLDGAATPGFRAADGYHPLSPRIAIDREEGVTQALLTPPTWKLLSGSGHVVEFTSRLTDVPEAKPAALVGGFDGGVAGSFGGSRGGLLLALREIVADARFYKKNQAAFDRGEARALALSSTHLAALSPWLDGQVPLIVRVDRASDIRALLAFATAEKLRIVVDGGTEAWLVADELAAAGVPVIVHPSSAGVISLDALHARDDLAAVLARAGVPVILSSWESVNGTTRLRQEAGLAVQNGMPYAEAIKAITSTPASLFGGKSPGVIKAGARASVVLWSQDPFEAVSIAERIWVGGAEVTEPSRPRQLAKKYQSLAKVR